MVNKGKVYFIKLANSLLGTIGILLNKPYKKDTKGVEAAKDEFKDLIIDHSDEILQVVPPYKVKSKTMTFPLPEVIEGILYFKKFYFNPVEFVVGSFNFYFGIGFSIFLVGFFGLILLRTNIISLLLSIELMILGISFCFIIISANTPVNFLYELRHIQEPLGYLVALIFLSLAASESAMGLALIVLVFKQYKNLSVTNFGLLRG